MEFLSQEVQDCATLFHHTGFDAAHKAVVQILSQKPAPQLRTESMALLFRINIERDEVEELENLATVAHEVFTAAKKFGLGTALYNLGIVFLNTEEPEKAEECFRESERLSKTDEGLAHTRYGLAACLHDRNESASAITLLENTLSTLQVTSDFLCLTHMLKGNCLKRLEKFDEALASYQEAQRLLPQVKSFYLKNWVYFGLGTLQARRGDTTAARTFLEVALSLTQPGEFRRLYRLTVDELARLDLSAEVLFDPITGDILSRGGYLSLRRKPILIALFRTLIAKTPEPVSKESLYLAVWGGEYHPLRHDSLLYSHIQRLRQLLASDPVLKDAILTAMDGYQINPDFKIRLKENGHNQEAHHET